jgi:uncharacterized protein YndB with AHSA1/START domain
VGAFAPYLECRPRPLDDLHDILITPDFGAPAALVYRAYTTPELVKQWWGFGTEAWVVCDIDLRVGGGWRHLTRHARRGPGTAAGP